jgi:hypothetical protein
MGYVAVLVYGITTTPVGAAARFPQDDLGEFFMGFGRPTSLGCQFWQPRNVAPLKGNLWLPICFSPSHLKFVAWPWGHGDFWGRWGLDCWRRRIGLRWNVHAQEKEGKR